MKTRSIPHTNYTNRPTKTTGDAGSSSSSSRSSSSSSSGSSSGGGGADGGGKVVTLTDDNFKETVVGSRDLWLVAFIAPWWCVFFLCFLNGVMEFTVCFDLIYLSQVVYMYKF